MSKNIKVKFKCSGCGRTDCSHDYVLKAIKDGEGYWVGQGPYSSREEAEAVITKTVEILEKQHNPSGIA